MSTTTVEMFWKWETVLGKLSLRLKACDFIASVKKDMYLLKHKEEHGGWQYVLVLFKKYCQK